MKSLDEVLTHDKFGSAATVIQGELGKLDGIPIVLTKHLEERQNALGIYDGTTETLTQLLVVNTRAFRLGVRRMFKLELVRKPLQGNQYIVASTRLHWRSIFDTSTEKVCGWLYNISK